jgi:hypothetical protein
LKPEFRHTHCHILQQTQLFLHFLSSGKKKKDIKMQVNWAKQVESKSHTSKELHASYEEEKQ